MSKIRHQQSEQILIANFSHYDIIIMATHSRITLDSVSFLKIHFVVFLMLIVFYKLN
jgi:hypothetical protein